MTHLKRILAVIVPLVVAGATSIVVSPAAQNFATEHPADMAYILLVAGVLSAVYKAFTAETGSSAGETTNTTGPGSNSMSAK